MSDRLKHINKFIEKEIVKKIPKREKYKFYSPREEKDDEIEDILARKKPRRKLLNSGTDYLTVGSGDNKFRIEIKRYSEERRGINENITAAKIVLALAVIFLAALFLYLGYMNYVYENQLASYTIMQEGLGYKIRSSGSSSDIILKKFSQSAYYIDMAVPSGAKVLKFSAKNATNYYKPSAQVLSGNNYYPTSTLREFNIALRGDHIIYTYIKDEPLQWSFEFRDLNRVSGKDEVNISVYDMSGKLIDSRLIPDDGNDSNLSAIIEKPRADTIRIKNLKEGVYKIVIRTTGDTLITKFATIQSRFVFKNHIFPADNLEYGLVDKPVEIYSDYPVNVSTYHTAGLQSIVSSGKTYNLSMINKQIQVSPGIIRMQKGDVVIDSPANIALSEEYHFDVEEWYNIAENLNTNYTYITLSDVGNKELYYYLDLKKLPVDAKRIKILLDSRENLKEIKLVFLRKEE